MKTITNLLLFLTFLLVSTFVDAQTWQETNKKETQYFQVALGYGVSYGGLGANLMYRSGYVVIHGGIGFGLYPLALIYDVDYNGEVTMLYGGGLKFYLNQGKGKNFTSIYIDTQFGLNGAQIYYTVDPNSNYEDYIVHLKKLYGPSMLLGYDFIFGGKQGKVGGNVGVGASYTLNGLEDKSKFFLALDWGVIFKIN